MHDCKLAGAVAKAGGELVTERTVRNWLGRHTTADVKLIEKLMANSEERLRTNLAGKAWPLDERQAFVDGLRGCPGFVSGFAYSLQNRCDLYPAFVRLAGQVDQLEQQLAEHRAAGDVRSWAQTLLSAEWIRDEQLEDPDKGTTAEFTRQQLRQAQSWEELDHPAKVFFVNTLFQLLATLDLEFGGAYLSDWEATPVFAALLPRLNPRIDIADKTSIRTTRNFYHYPVRRLLDATACIRVMFESPVRKWPSRIPPASRMVEWLQLRGHATLASNVAKWRGGRTLTAERFAELWDECFHFGHEADRPPPPIPMLFAATLFSELFIKGSMAKGDLTFVSPDPAFYLHWWRIQRQVLENGLHPLRFGSKPWMPSYST